MNISAKDARKLLDIVDSVMFTRLERLRWKSPVEVTVHTYLSPEQEKVFCDWYWAGMCPTCGSIDCANLKNSSAMCPGPAP